MTFIRTVVVQGKRYVQVADYFYVDKKRKFKLLRSLGLFSFQSEADARSLLANIRQVEKFKRENIDKTEQELMDFALKIGNGFLGAYLGLNIIKWIICKKGP